MYQYKTIILIINIVSILFLLGLAILLLYIKRNNKAKTLPQIIVITITIPFYLYNIFFITESFKAMLYIAPFTYSVGLCFLPALWISIHQYFNSQSRFSKIRLIHFFPAFICFLIYSAYINRLTIPEQINFFVYKNTPWANLIDGLNLIMLITQIIIYFSIILLYLHRVKQFIEKNYTFADWKRNLWIPKILIAITITFIILLVFARYFLTINLLSSTTSKSTIVNSPTPALASISQTYPPTPPTPNIATLLLASLSRASPHAIERKTTVRKNFR